MPYSGLWRHFLAAINALLLFTLATLSTNAIADINSATPSPATISVPAKGIATVNVLWRVNRTEAAALRAPVTRNVSSSSASLLINGSTVATLAGSISKSSTLANTESETLMFNESFTLNAGLARRIASSPAGSVQIMRLFTDTQRVATGVVRLFTGSGNSGPLAVRRIDLAFENSARTDVVYQKDVVHAIADISFRSSGILKGEWRIVDPTASLGSSGGRVLRVVRQNLVSSGEGRTRIVSPPLPTNNNGLYFVSFVVTDSNNSFETPILRYFVLDDKDASLNSKPSEITVLSPANGADLSQNTVFTWQVVPSALAYQVEVFNEGELIPLTGKLVPATELKLSLSALSFEWLSAGHEYNWRIRALGVGGKLLAQSEMQMVFLP